MRSAAFRCRAGVVDGWTVVCMTFNVEWTKPAKPWHYAVAVIVFLFWAFSYGKSTFTGVNLEKDKATVLSIATGEARRSNALAVLSETRNITTAAHIAEALSESALDPSIYEITKTPQILATSCATITLKRDGGETVSAHVSLETKPDGSVVAVAAEGRCPA